MVRQEVINPIKRGHIILKINKLGQRKSFLRKISNRFLICEYWMNVDFFVNEKRKISTQSLWSIRKDWIFMECLAENKALFYFKDISQNTKDKIEEVV